MKRLITILFFILTPLSLFGFYGDGSGRSLIDFLMDRYQLRARTDQIGVLYGVGIGDGDFIFSLGVTGNTSGVILDNWTNDSSTNKNIKSYFRPSVMLAMGYKSDKIGVGVGYQFKYVDSNYMVHTPVLTLMIKDNTLRFNIPLAIGVGNHLAKNTFIVSTSIEARYYLHKFIDYFTQIANAAKCPIIMYNVPSRTGVKLPISVIKKLSEVSNIEAIKEASGDISYTADIASEVPNLDLYSGNDDMVTPILALGGKGVISVTSNIVPRENHDMVMNYLNGNIKEAIKTQIHFIDLIRAMFIEVNPVPIKYAMNIIGFEVGDCRSPLGPLSEKNKEHVKEIIKKYGVKK